MENVILTGQIIDNIDSGNKNITGLKKRMGEQNLRVIAKKKKELLRATYTGNGGES